VALPASIESEEDRGKWRMAFEGFAVHGIQPSKRKPEADGVRWPEQ
jgi:hypothetical protein